MQTKFSFGKRRFSFFRSGGFTLIEILLVLLLLVVISGIVFTSLWVPLRAVAAAKIAVQNTEEEAVFISRLSEEIAAVFPQEKTFLGTEKGLEFLTAYGVNTGLEKVGYYSEETEEEELVIYREAMLPFALEKDDAAPVFRVTELRLSYYDGKAWQNEWQKEVPPFLVRMEVQRKGKESQFLFRPRSGFSGRTDADSGLIPDNGTTTPLS